MAVDVEHHGTESFKGFTCLLQLSVCSERAGTNCVKDFVVDPFPLFEHLTMLNRLTANPRILKVLHGMNCDVLWLQAGLLVEK